MSDPTDFSLEALALPQMLCKSGNATSVFRMRSTVNTQLRMKTQIVLASNSKLVLLDRALSVSQPKDGLPVHYLPFLLSILLYIKAAGTYLSHAQNRNCTLYFTHYMHQQLLKPDGAERL